MKTLMRFLRKKAARPDWPGAAVESFTAFECCAAWTLKWLSRRRNPDSVLAKLNAMVRAYYKTEFAFEQEMAYYDRMDWLRKNCSTEQDKELTLDLRDSRDFSDDSGCSVQQA